jgi:hypothetical protein
LKSSDAVDVNTNSCCGTVSTLGDHPAASGVATADLTRKRRGNQGGGQSWRRTPETSPSQVFACVSPQS